MKKTGNLPKRVRWCVAALLGLAGQSLSALEGTGFGRDESEARQRAAADLAAAIQVQVKSVVESCVQVKRRQAEDCGSRVSSRVATDLPMLGLTYERVPGENEPVGARARLDKAALPLYEQQLARWKREFLAQREALATTTERQQRHASLSRQLVALRAYQDHRLVATAIGATIEDAPGSEAVLMSERVKLEDRADSLAFAAKLLMKDIDGTIAAAEPLRAAGSREVTPFGGAMADALRAEMTGRTGAGLRISGEYRILDNGDIDLVLEVHQAAAAGPAELAGVRSVRLLKDAYAGYRATPLAPDFEQLLKSGEAVSTQLRNELVTTRGAASSLLFQSGESLKLAARVSRAAYFYVVGHVVRSDGQYSYLLPVQEDAEGPAKFVRRVPADQANHYIEIGEFTVEPPYGAEHLQMIASTEDPASALPPHEYDAVLGYYVLRNSNGNVMKGLRSTRGLRPKPTTKRMVAEHTLTFTTRE